LSPPFLLAHKMDRESMKNSDLQALKQLFDECDTNKDNRLDVTELMELMKKGGFSNQFKDAISFVVQADKDADGQIDFDELHDYLLSQRKIKGPEHRSQLSTYMDSQLLELGKTYEKENESRNGLSLLSKPSNTKANHYFDEHLHAKVLVIFNGEKKLKNTLNRFEFIAALKKAGAFVEKDTLKYISKADQDGDTKIDFNEFISFLWKNRDRLTITDRYKEQTETNNDEEQKFLVLPTIPIEMKENESQEDDQSEEVTDASASSSPENLSEKPQDDEKETVDLLPCVSAETKSVIKSMSLVLLAQLDKLDISSDEQLEFFKHLIDSRKSKPVFVEMASADL